MTTKTPIDELLQLQAKINEHSEAIHRSAGPAEAEAHWKALQAALERTQILCAAWLLAHGQPLTKKG